MNIASLEDTAVQMGQVSKLMRLLASSGIGSEHLQRAIDNKSARINLVEFLNEGCPKVDYTQSAPKAKRGTRSVEPTTLVNPEEFFVSSLKFYVDPDLARNIDLAPVADDARELKQLFALPRHMNDSAIAKEKSIGGMEALRTKKTTLPQLMRECKRALAGETTLFQVGHYYLLYLEGKGGALCPVGVCWDDGQLRVGCCRFDQVVDWDQGVVVCGN